MIQRTSRSYSRLEHLARRIALFRNWAVMVPPFNRFGGKTRIVRLRSGPAIELGDIFSSDFAIAMEMFDEDVYKLRELALPHEPVVFDIGANIGLFSVALHERYPDALITAYEPHPRNFALLARNAPFAKRVQCAVTDRDGTVEIQKEGNPGELALVDKDGIRVPAVSLDTALSGIDHLALLKVDVEGSERRIFEESSRETLQKIQRVVIEVSEGQESWFENFFSNAEFSFAWIGPRIFSAWK